MHSAAKALLAFALLSVACLLPEPSQAEVYDPNGFIYSVAFGDNWYTTQYPNPINITTSDSVMFQYTSEHDTYLNDANSCSGGTQIVPIACGGGSNCAEFKGSDYTVGTTRYVYCHVTGHCALGMIVQINIVEHAPTARTHAPVGGDASVTGLASIAAASSALLALAASL